MNAVLLFEFSVDKENKAINVQREFAADLGLVWDAWTKPELLDQWWAPKPYQTKTKSMDFRAGGTWLYAMISPENVAHWCRVDFKEVEQLKKYSALDGFCDEEGVLNQEFPRSRWTNLFKGNGQSTVVSVAIQFEELSDLEKLIAMGFREGFTMALGNLDQCLEAQFQLR
jgi:PhnB protein